MLNKNNKTNLEPRKTLFSLLSKKYLIGFMLCAFFSIVAPTASDASPINSNPIDPPNIISRSAWGADENIFDWDPKYGNTLEKFILCHTATGDSADEKATMRAMYRDHASTRNWGDIGYNFVIDRDGNIYEGRKGGTDSLVIAAHTYGHNTNSVGVAVMGNYNEEIPSDKMLDSLAKLIGWKAAKHGTQIDASNILPARTLNGFASPGTNIEKNLDNIIKKAQEYKEKYI